MPACADRDIVYSARYYYPPGDRRMSHFHLYRIRPDGTGRIQLTSSNADDYDPLWSPKGDRIIFWRGDNLCMIDPLGTKLRTIVRTGSYEYCHQIGWSPDSTTIYIVLATARSGEIDHSHRLILVNAGTGHNRQVDKVSEFAWSSNGERIYVGYEDGTYRIVDRSFNAKSSQVEALHQPVWLPDETVAGVDLNTDIAKLRLLDSQGRLRKEIAFKEMKPGSEDADLIGWYVKASTARNSLICALNEAHGVEGTRRVWGYYLADTAKSTLDLLCEGSSLSLSPNRKLACTVPPTDTTAYGSSKLVYAAPLQTISIDTGKTRTVVGGLVWVWSADWRKPVAKGMRQ